MTDKKGPSELVQRLHRLRIQRGLTIQEMADRCGLPKSSLESYMRMEGARRPGLEALVSIGDGMGVSIDWIVGRAEDSFEPGMTKKDYAMACFGIVQSLLHWMRSKQGEQASPIIESETVAGIPDAEVAAKSMLIFTEMVEVFSRNGKVWGENRAALHDELRVLLDRETGTE